MVAQPGAPDQMDQGPIDLAATNAVDASPARPQVLASAAVFMARSL